MCCVICIVMTQRHGRHTNPLVYAPKYFRGDIVIWHAHTSYHCRAVHLESSKTALSLQDVAVRLLPQMVPQVKALFHTIYSIPRCGMAWSQFNAELDL